LINARTLCLTTNQEVRRAATAPRNAGGAGRRALEDKAGVASHRTGEHGNKLSIPMFGRPFSYVFEVVLLAVAMGACSVPGSASETSAPIVAPPAQQDAAVRPPAPSIFHKDPASACAQE
jgi:hypothetical protein